MKKKILNNYRNKIKSILNALPKEDKKILENYLRFRRVKASDEKVQHYKTNLLILRDTAQKTFKQFNDKILIDNLLILIKNSNKLESGKNELRKLLKNFLKWLFNDLTLIENIKSSSNKVNRAKINKNNFPTDEEVLKMFKKCKNLKEKCMLTIQDELGLRPSEILNLSFNQIKIYDNHAVIQINGTKTPNAIRTLPLKTALIHLKRYKQEFEYPNLREDDFVFPSSEDRKKPLNSHYLSYLYRKLSKRANLTRIITPYMLRHRRITFVWEKTQDLKLTSKFGGHSIEVCENVYQHSSDNDIKDLIMEKVYEIKELTPEEDNELKKLKKQFEKEKFEKTKVIEDLSNQLKKHILKVDELLEGGYEKELQKYYKTFDSKKH